MENISKVLTGKPSSQIWKQRPFDNEECLYLDGANQCVGMGNAHRYEHDEPFSVSAWIKTTTWTSTICSCKQLADQRGWEFFLNQSSLQVQLINDNSPSLRIYVYTTFAAGFLSDDVWHHVGFWYTGSGIASGVQIVIDGTLCAMTTAFDTLGGNTIVGIGEFIVGGMYNPLAPTYDWTGNIDELSVWDTALTFDQMEKLRNDGKARNLRRLDFHDHLASWYRFDGDVSPNVIDHGHGGHDGILCGGASIVSL